ncbi:hypothetical protein NQ317_014590 [Molorchus minor]|uniref:Uncharacterized protein n=1 Tax=Molorchus minor TaxID=1323400 RepID=A0ABQ9K4P6_9CUCU|nr:hypothetical protein NQ317_014590 [Molorchus minor]
MAHVYARPHHMLQTEDEVLEIVEDDPSTSTKIGDGFATTNSDNFACSPFHFSCLITRRNSAREPFIGVTKIHHLFAKLNPIKIIFVQFMH